MTESEVDASGRLKVSLDLLEMLLIVTISNKNIEIFFVIHYIDQTLKKFCIYFLRLMEIIYFNFWQLVYVFC